MLDFVKQASKISRVTTERKELECNFQTNKGDKTKKEQANTTPETNVK